MARTIAAVDLSKVAAGQPSGHSQSTCFLASLSGEGRVQIDGRWHSFRAGTACLLPGHAMEVVPATRGRSWEFCWVCFGGLKVDGGSLGVAPDVVMARFDPVPLRCAIEGLARECGGEAVPKDVQGWADLIQSYVARIVPRGIADKSLAPLWERVSAELAADWDLSRLAAEAGYSRGHLGRLCRQQLRRSPMHQVTWLRMRRAAELLASTNLSVEAVAQSVGYANPFVFSNAFTRWVGCRPSDYRRRSNKQSAGALLL